MKSAIFRRIFPVLTIFLYVSASVYSQENTVPAAEPETVFIDFLFNEYIELEKQIFEETDDSESISAETLEKIGVLENKAVSANRKDIISRLRMLNFIIESDVYENELNLNADTALHSIRETEKIYRRTKSTEKIGRKAFGITIGTAVVSGTIFAASSLASSGYYEKYTQTEYADQAAFYLFWWQLLEDVSTGSAILTVASSAAAGILAAVF